MIPLFDAPPAPRGLLFLATFSKRERAEIASSPDLLAAIRAGFAGRVARRSCANTGKPNEPQPVPLPLLCLG